MTGDPRFAPAGPDAAGRTPVPAAETVLDVLRLPAAAHPDQPAISFSTDATTITPATWGEIWEAACRQAARLRQLGAARQEPVLLAIPTSRLFFDVFFGILAAGGVPVPIAPPTSLSAQRLGWYSDLLARIAGDAGARFLCTTSRLAPVVRELTQACGTPVSVVVADEPPPEAAAEVVLPAPHDLALLQYTSGSTSMPKGVALSHANIISNARIIGDAIAGPGDACVSWLPLYHDMGLIGAALTGLYTRTPVLFLPTTLFVKEPASWLRAISAFRATITLAPNFAFGHAVRHAAAELLDGVSLATLHTALNGAEPVDAEAVEAFEQRFAPLGLRPGTVRPVYGLAESALAVTFTDPGVRTVDAVDAEVLETEGRAAPSGSGRARRFASVGRPLPTQQVRIVDGAGRAVPDRVVGEIVVSGPSVMQGYYRRPDDTDAALRGGWLHTGDLGYLADGELFITGRIKDVIIRNGRNYYPADIEAAIAGLAGVLRGGVAAFGVNDGPTERVVVAVETRFRDDAERAGLARAVRDRCQEAFLFGPDETVLLGAGGIPRTTSGKVRRAECRRRYLAQSLVTGRTPVPPARPRTTAAADPS